MYNPKFEDDFFIHIPERYKNVYLHYLLRNIGLFADNEPNEKRAQFLYFLISREGLEASKNGATIHYNDEDLTP